MIAHATIAADHVFVSEATGEDGKPITSTPYWVIHPGGAQDVQERLSGHYGTRWPQWTIHAVGENAAEVEWATEQMDSALRPKGRGLTLPVTGRTTYPLRRDVLGPIDIDRDINPPLFFQPSEYRFKSAPAA
jgi:hypothetical protein